MKRNFYFQKWGYTKKDFQKWGRKGGLVFKYSSPAERQRAYRRRKVLARIETGLVEGVLNLETGRVRKYRNSASRQKEWRESITEKVMRKQNNYFRKGFWSYQPKKIKHIK